MGVGFLLARKCRWGSPQPGVLGQGLRWQSEPLSEHSCRNNDAVRGEQVDSIGPQVHMDTQVLTRLSRSLRCIDVNDP